jgi:Protein of unknown function (DUF3551)
MTKMLTVGLALSAMFAAVGEVHAYVNYPWCAMGDTRGIDCVFATKEQCAQDGRGRGFGTQCILNPAYNPGQPSVVEGGRFVQGAVAARAQVRKSSRHKTYHH